MHCQVFKKKSGDFLRYLRNSAKDPNGPGRIWTAGEAENAFRKKRTAEGKGGEVVGWKFGKSFGYIWVPENGWLEYDPSGAMLVSGSVHGNYVQVKTHGKRVG